jgi:mRNA interferase YafQ
MRAVRASAQFKKDLKRSGRQSRNIERLQDVIGFLQSGDVLDETFRDHSLTGNWRDHRECHVAPDWLLIYKLIDGELRLARIGSHAELFR